MLFMNQSLNMFQMKVLFHIREKQSMVKKIILNKKI